MIHSFYIKFSYGKENTMDTLIIYGQTVKHNVKEGIKDFLKKERGGSEIVATIVLIAIVVLLAVLFKDQIGALVNSMWRSINANADPVINEGL